MPELPDVEAYLEALRERVLGQPLERIRLRSPFVLRTVRPEPSAFEGRRVEALRRIGKRMVLSLEGGMHVVIHLMIAGRLHWKTRGARPPGKIGLAAFDFPSGTLLLTEAGTRKRVSIHLVEGGEALGAFERGGIEPLKCDVDLFRTTLERENHTLKRALADPRLFSGIGNAYSDEILHRARLSPLRLTSRLTPDDVARLHDATRAVLVEWTGRLREDRKGAFPEKVTAFRDGMAVHGRFGRPCPVCGTAVQRIVYADNECNYCPRCQTDGRVLADRALSRLLRGDWPRSIEELEDDPGLNPGTSTRSGRRISSR